MIQTLHMADPLCVDEIEKDEILDNCKSHAQMYRSIEKKEMTRQRSSKNVSLIK